MNLKESDNLKKRQVIALESIADSLKILIKNQEIKNNIRRFNDE